MSGRGTRAVEALRAAGVQFTIHEYDVADGGTDRRHAYGAEAAAALAVDPERMLKTLIVTLDDGRLAVAIVPVASELDLKAFAGAVGARKATLAEAAAAERATGYVVGGISPFGQRRRLPVVVDGSVVGLRTVLVSGGRRGLQLELAPGDLVDATTATVAAIRR